MYYDYNDNINKPTGSQPSSIAIPDVYTEIMCRYNYVETNDRGATTEIRTLSQLQPGEKLMSELFLVFERYSDNYYYFHTEVSRNYSDNNALIFAK